MAQGSISKRHLAGGGQWDVVVDLGADPVTGKRRPSKKTFTTRKEAQAALTAWQGDIDKGMDVPASKTTVGAYLAYWLDTSARHRVRASTFESYAAKVRLYVVPTLGPVPL